MEPTCEHPATGWVSAAGGSNSNAPTSPALRHLPQLQVKRCSLLSSRTLTECPKTPLETGRWAVSRIAEDMSFRQPRLPTAAIRTPIPGASCTRHSAYTCRRRLYGGTCKTDADCYYNGINYGIACWDNGNGKPVCSGRGFIKNTSCDPSVCTFQNGYLGSKAWQPPYAQCSDVSNNSSQCIGDDTVHQVMRKAYTWPNDPQIYGGDAPLYRIVFAPGGTSVPITRSVGQAPGISTESGVPVCSALPDYYGYDSQYSGLA